MKRFYKVAAMLVLLMVISVYAFAVGVTYQCVATADTLMNSKTYQFDVYLYRTGPTDFYLNNYQLSFKISNTAGVLNGGVITGEFVTGSSGLPPEFLPGSVSVFNIGGAVLVRVNGCPATSNGTLIPTSGVKVGSIRLTNSYDYGQMNPNTIWWNNSPAATHVFAIFPPAPTGTVAEITNIASHTTLLTDPLLNTPPVAFNMTGTGNYCYGGTGIPVGLDGSETNSRYMLVKNGTPVGSYFPGTGLALAFGNQTVGTYTVTANRKATYVTGPMAGSAVITYTDYHISGYAKYNNNPKTPLNGLKISLKQGGTLVGTYTTGTTGYYQFTNVINGTYNLEVATAHPSGQWQTWSGVNNTDYLLVLRHISSGPLLPSEPPVVRIAANVRNPAIDINTADVDAIRFAAKYGWGSPTPYFNIPKWVFSGTNTAAGLTAIPLNCENVTRNIMGLCAGDVNGSYVPPNGYKDATANLELINRGRLAVTPEITFPVRAENDMEVGAITIFLNYDASLLDITGVKMPKQGDEAPYFILRGNMLHIGWASQNPIRIVKGETILTIQARVKDPSSSTIHFSLNQDPLCELADGDGNVLDNAKVVIADAGPITNEPADLLSVYPNPATDILNIEYLMDTDGLFNAELVTLQGIVVAKTDKISSKAGLNKTVMNMTDLPNGAFLLRVVCGNNRQTSKVIVNH